MNWPRSWQSAGVLAAALALVSPAAGAPREQAPARTSVPGAKPAILAALPDLVATHAFVGIRDPATNTYKPVPAAGVEPGRQLQIACFYSNAGSKTSSSFRIRHVIDGHVVGVSSPLPGVAGGAKGLDGRSYTAGAVGQHRYECTVNFDNAAPDRTSDNNSAAADFLVHGPAAMTPRELPKPNVPAAPQAAPFHPSAVDLTVPQIFAQDGFWSTDWQVIGEATLTATVKNVGMEAAPSRAWKWQWIVDGVPRGCGTSDPRFSLIVGQPASFGLSPGESRAVSFYFRGLTDGDLADLTLGFVRTYQVKVRFNCDLGQAERSDANNESRLIPVWFKARLGVPGMP